MLKNIFFQCRQRPRETYTQFIKREVVAAFYIEKTETRQDKARRLAREEQNRNQPVPRHCNPAVFVWTTEDDMQYRRQIRTSRIRELWERTTQLQRKYNSIRNEYNVDDTAHNNRIDVEGPVQTVEIESMEPLHSLTVNRCRLASPVPRGSEPVRQRLPIRLLHVNVANVSHSLQTNSITCLTVNRNSQV